MTGRRVLLIAVVAVRLVAEERAQLAGAIRDSSESILRGADVTATNMDTGIRRSTRSGDNGEFAIASLPAGMYKIIVRKSGFQTIARLNVRLNPGERSQIDFAMHVGSTRTVVTIIDAPPLIDVDDASVGLLAGARLVEDLPLNGRQMLAIAALAPGAVPTPATLGEAGQLSANGQRPNANFFRVDGVSANTGVSGSATPAQFSGGTLPAMTAFGSTETLASPEEIDELRIQTSSFAPEFGNAPGANVSIVTRSGGNELHGEMFYAGRNNRANANDWFANQAGLSRAPAKLSHWGAAGGGPLRRDRTFWFANYEALRMGDALTALSAVPDLNSRAAAPARLRPVLQAFPLPNGRSLGSGLADYVANLVHPSALDVGSVRLDHTINSRATLFGRFQEAPSSTESGIITTDKSLFQNEAFTVGISTLLGPNLNGDLRLNATGASVQSRWVASGAGGATPVNLGPLFGLLPANGNALYGLGIGGVGQLLSGIPSHSRQRQFDVVESTAWNKNMHVLRWGAEYDRLTPERDASGTSYSAAYLSLADLLRDGPMLVSVLHADEAGSVVQNLSIFVQDTWRMTSRLTATYGLRWELTPAPEYRGIAAVPSIAPAASPLWPTRYAQFAPRFGIAYRLARATVLRGGWGVFYDAEFGVATDPINASPYNRWQFASVLPGTAPPSNTPFSGYGYAPGLRLPYAREWNVSLEHAFRETDVFSASYVGSAGRHLLRREAPAPTGLQVADNPLATNHGASDFAALELHYRRKLRAGLQALASYSWSHSLDNGSWDSGVYVPASVAYDRASSAFDVRQNFSSGFSWHVRQWTLSALMSARSGFPIEVLDSENLLGLGFDDYQRPNRVPGVAIWNGGRLNSAAFSLAVPGVQGNLGRNAITGFGSAQLDAALGREFVVRERGVASFRLEAYNVANHAQFGDPVRFLDSPLFGRSVSMLNLMLGAGTPHSGNAPGFQSGGPRVLQAKVTFQF